jgi:uncharacterized protein (TIGR03437 family)
VRCQTSVERILILLAGSLTGILPTANPAFCQPLINGKGVLNNASFTPPDLPGGAVAAGSMITILGRGLGPSTPAVNPPMPVTVQVIQNGQATAATPIYASDSKVRAVLPASAPLGRASIQVTFNGASSNLAPVTIVKSQLGLFGANDGAGFGPALATFADQTVTLTATGAGDGSDPVSVWVGGVAATNIVVSPGVAPGIDNIQFTIPDSAPQGCAVPVQAQTASGAPSNTVTIAAAADGGPCQDSPASLNTFQQATGNVGLVLLFQATGANIYLAGFYATPAGSAQAFFLPPPESCVELSTTGNLLTSQALQALSDGLKPLSAGLPLVGPFADPDLFARLMQAIGFYGSTNGPPGPWVLQSPGGADVGPFQVTLQPPAPISWTKASNMAAITRASGMTVAWNTGAVSQEVLVLGYSYQRSVNSSGLFVCLANGMDGQFTVPAYVLERLPPTAANALATDSALLVAAFAPDQAVSFSAPGLDAGFAYALSGTAMPVVFR